MCYLKVTEFLSHLHGRLGLVTETKNFDNMHLIRIYCILSQTGESRYNGVLAEWS